MWQHLETDFNEEGIFATKCHYCNTKLVPQPHLSNKGRERERDAEQIISPSLPWTASLSCGASETR